MVIRFSSIGDIVLTTPVVRALKLQAGLEVHYLTKKAFAGILEPNPHLDKVHLLKDDFSELISSLKAEGFDHVVDLHKNLRSKRVIQGLKLPASSFPKLNLKKFLLTQFKVNLLPNLHIVDRYFEAGRDFGIKPDGKGLDYFLPAKEYKLETFLEEPQLSGYIGFVIGGQHATKMLPEAKILKIVKGLDKPVVLLGGPEDADKGNRIALQAGEKVFNAAGKFKLDESAFLVKSAESIISHDTGLMHIAAAFGKKIISIWGNTVPDFGMYPYFPGSGSEQIEVQDLSCRPCSKIGYEKCPKAHFRCMQDIPVKRVIQSAIPE